MAVIGSCRGSIGVSFFQVLVYKMSLLEVTWVHLDCQTHMQVSTGICRCLLRWEQSQQLGHMLSVPGCLVVIVVAKQFDGHTLVPRDKVRRVAAEAGELVCAV